MKYNRCKRCELNYIKDGETYCELCKKELSGKYKDYGDNITENICPYCDKNKLEFGEEICRFCKNKKLKKKFKKDNKNNL